MAQDRVVMCMKWGTLYSGDYVNILYRAVKAHITGPFRFVCLTDDTTGLDPNIKAFPIPDLGLSEADWKKGGWPKLGVFKRDLYGLTGRCLFVDLDTVISGPLDEFFDYPGEMVAIDTGPTWGVDTPDGKPLAGTGIFAFTLGAHGDILDDFLADKDGVVKAHRIEQIYVQSKVPDMGFWPKAWVTSFKYHQRRPALIGLIVPPKPPVPETRVIAFHGDPRPIDLVNGGLWGIGPHWGYGKVKWMTEYWSRFGGKV